MLVVIPDVSVRKRRSPCGERGLKFGLSCLTDVLFMSLPVRGAWVEIARRADSNLKGQVAPRAGSVG